MKAKTWSLITAGAGIFALFRYFKTRKARGRQDRPPMIVKGGSLIFQSGDDRTSEEGVKWREIANGRWTPDQPGGRTANRMHLTADPKDGECDISGLEVTNVRISYATPREFEFFQVVPAGGIPLVIATGPGRFTVGSEPDYPTLSRPGSGSLFTVSYKVRGGKERQCQTSRVRIDFSR